MIRRLVLDFVVRLRWMYVFLVGTLTILLPVLDAPGGSVTFPLGLVLMLAAVGPFAAMSQLAPNTYLLPVSRREIWRAQWTIAMLLPPTVTMAGWCAAALFQMLVPVMSPPSLSTMFLVGTYQLAYSGLVLCVLAFLGRARRRPAGRWSSFADGLAMAALIGSFFAGFAIAEYLPVTGQNLDTLRGVLLILALAATVMTYQFVPATVPRPGMRARPLASPPRRKTRHSWPGGLTGLPRLLARETLTVGFGLAAVWLVFRVLDPSATIEDSVWIGCGFAFALSSSGLRSLARPMRVLPISGMQLTAILTTLPLAKYAVLLVMLSLSGALSIGLSASSIAFAICFAGASVMIDACLWRYGSGWSAFGGMVAFGAFFALSRQIAERLDTPSGLTATWIGLVCVVIGALINYRTVFGSPDAFKPRPQPFQG